MKLLLPLGLAAAAVLGLIAERALGDNTHSEAESVRLAASSQAPQDATPAVKKTDGDAPAKISATIKGRIKFKGELPKPKALLVTEAQSKGCCAADKKVDDTDRSLRVHKDGGVRDCVVSIKIEGQKLAPADKPLNLDQKNCRFEPFILLAPVGSEVLFKNSDEATHNVHAHVFMNNPFNRAMGKGGVMTVKLDAAERVKITCDYHNWMTSWIIVTDAAHATLTGEDGGFEISGLAPGKYTIDLWHPKLGKAKTEVVVAEDGSSELVEFEMAMPVKKTKRRRRRD